MLANIGSGLQLVGMTLLPAAMVLNLLSGDNFAFGVSNMLVLMVFGVAVFYLGYIVRGYGEHGAEGDDPPPSAKKKKSKKHRQNV